MPDHAPLNTLCTGLCELAEVVKSAVKEDVGPIREELTLVRSLLQDAGLQLTQSFMQLDTQARSQMLQASQMFADATSTNRASDSAGPSDVALEARLETLGRTSKQVSKSIDEAVRALQFEDMATQLIDCVQRRIARLDTVVNHLEGIVRHFERAPRGSETAGLGSLAELNQQLTSLKNEYANAVISPVASTGLAGGGSVDLF